MRKSLSIVFWAVLLQIVSSQGTWANGALPPGTITHSDRTVLGSNIAHYRFDVVVGPGPFDVIRLHRIVREAQPLHPVRTVNGVFLLPGSPNFFEAIFMAPLISQVPAWDRSIAVFLAENNIDVWGMDYAWALVPAETTHLDFMKGWGMEKDIQHTGIGLSVARQIRLITGQGFGPLHVLGFCYGGQIAYSLAGNETQHPPLSRHIKGIIVGDIPMRFKEKSIRDYYCSDMARYQAMLDAGEYSDDTGLLLKQASDLALSEPNDSSPIIPGLTNYQTALFVGATGNPPIPWHFVGGAFDENGIPTDLRYTEAQLWLDFLQVVPPHLPVQTDLDGDALFCGEVKVPFGHHLGEINVPILYVGAGGGFGQYGYYTTTLTASKDVTKFTVSVTGDRSTDFGHADLFLSGDAETLAWRPILNWLKAHP